MHTYHSLDSQTYTHLGILQVPSTESPPLSVPLSIPGSLPRSLNFSFSFPVCQVSLPGSYIFYLLHRSPACWLAQLEVNWKHTCTHSLNPYIFRICKSLLDILAQTTHLPDTLIFSKGPCYSFDSPGYTLLVNACENHMHVRLETQTFASLKQPAPGICKKNFSRPPILVILVLHYLYHNFLFFIFYFALYQSKSSLL